MKNKLKRENRDPIPTHTTPTMSQNQVCDSAQVVYKTNRLSVQRGIFLPIEILEQEIDFLLDTGADITLISIGTRNNIPEDLKPSLQNSEGQAHNVEGKPLSLLGTLTAPLHIGDTSFSTTVYVAEIQQQGILGLDLLYQIGCAIDFNLKCLITKQGLVLPMKINDKSGSVC